MAIALFAEKGYASTSVNEIVRQADVSKPVLYYYFGSKEGMFHAILDWASDRQEALLGEVLKMSGTALDRLQFLYQRIHQGQIENPNLFRMIHNLIFGSPQGAPPYDFRQYHGRLADAIKRIYLEGRARNGAPIRPKSITARTHAITRMPTFDDRGHLRSNYRDIDDFSVMHVVFEDGTVADVFASDIVMGGIHNWLEVTANNHRSICNINPNTAMQTYNPVAANFDDIYVVEKIGTKEGWNCPSPDEDWFTGYPQEIEAFYRTVAYGEEPESDSSLAADCITTIYSGYVSAERGGADTEIPLL